MKFTLQGRTYDIADLDLVSLRDIMVFEAEASELFGYPVSWVDVGRWGEDLDKLKTEKEKLEHPAALRLTAVTIWATRRIAGEKLTFDEAIDFPMRDLELINEPARKAAAPANPTKRRRAASAPDAGNAVEAAPTEPLVTL